MSEERNEAKAASYLNEPVQVRADAEDRTLETSRIFDAPRERVFEAWTDPEHVSNWWGPRGFSTTTQKMDLRDGGEWLFVMHGPDGRDYGNRVNYLEVVRPERLVYRHSGTDDNDPIRFHVTVEFLAHGARTEVKMRMQIDTAEMYAYAAQHGAIEGLQDTMTRFGEELARVA